MMNALKKPFCIVHCSLLAVFCPLREAEVDPKQPVSTGKKRPKADGQESVRFFVCER